MIKSASKYSGEYLKNIGQVDSRGEGCLLEDFTNLPFPNFLNTQLKNWKSRACRDISGNSCVNLMNALAASVTLE